MKKIPWTHYSLSGSMPGGTAACGKIIRRCEIRRTSKLNEVTCSRCIDKLKESHWYCSKCGFIDDCYVTNDERCDVCGNDV